MRKNRTEAKRPVRNLRAEVFCIVEVSTKTPLVIYPTENMVGARISPFKAMSILIDLQEIIEHAKVEKI
jgi:hypothetical protein